MSTLQERMEACRKEKDWNQSELARRVHSKQRTIASIESRNSTGSPALVNIAKAFGVNYDWLVHGRGPKTGAGREAEIFNTYMACNEDAKWLIDMLLADPAFTEMVAAKIKRYAQDVATKNLQADNMALPGQSIKKPRLGRARNGSNQSKSGQG